MQPKILLVDDREDNLLSIEAILEPDGYQFFKAYSGSQALKILLSEFDFAMILMDVKMPILNGFETATLIYERERLKHIPIIFITANNYGDENVFKGYQAGGIDYIFKPINPDVLRAKVAVFIDLYRKNRLLFEQDERLLGINKSLESEISERKATEERLLENIAHLELVKNDFERFSFVASHDLAEPLHKITATCDRLLTKQKDTAPGTAKMIAEIKQDAERIQAAIAEILAFSKISMEKPQFVKSDMNLLLKGLLAEMDEEVRAKRATISVDPLPSLYISPRLMRPLFQNLIDNALKYGRENTNPTIRIRSEMDNGDNKNLDYKYCHIFVEDNGIGFDQKYAEEIFDIFKRLPHNGVSKGSGIGLALCKKIIDQHHGLISAQSKVNEGSTFKISLPLMPEETQ